MEISDCYIIISGDLYKIDGSINSGDCLFDAYGDERIVLAKKDFADKSDLQKLSRTVYQRNYNEENIDHLRGYRKQYYRDHKEHIQQYQKEYNEEHKEELKEKRKKYYEEHREELLEKQHARRRTPQGKADSARHKHRRRALKKKTQTERLPRNYRNMIFENQRGLCYYCGEPLTEENITLEHKIPLSRGGPHIFDNLSLACAKCNRKKWTMTEDEFREFLKENDDSQ